MSNIVACPHCGAHALNDGSRVGQVGACPKCHGKFVMPPLEMAQQQVPPAIGPAENSGPLIDTSRRSAPSRFVPPVPAEQGMGCWQIFGIICTVLMLIGGLFRIMKALMMQR